MQQFASLAFGFSAAFAILAMMWEAAARRAKEPKTQKFRRIQVGIRVVLALAWFLVGIWAKNQ